MSCGKHDGKGRCVCDVLREIARAQDRVSPAESDCCELSCDRSIQNLLAGVQDNGRPDTIPVILYCDCKPFLGFGVEIENGDTPRFECVKSFIFRVCSVDEDCCAVLELLETEESENPHNPCDQLNNARIDEIERTGICITVDLSRFDAVSCLPAVKAERD